MAKCLGWIDRREDWNKSTSGKKFAVAKELSEDEWQEFQEITQVISELRPFIIDYLGVERDYIDVDNLESQLTEEVRRIGYLPILSDTGFIFLHTVSQRAVSNFLSSSHSLLARFECRTIRIYGAKSQVAEDFKALRQTLYSDSFAYRLCYHLRNYALHQESPLDIVPVQAVAELEGYKITVKLELLRDKLLENVRNIKEELKDRPARIRLVPLVQEYFCSLSLLFRFVITTQMKRLQNLAAYIRHIKSGLKLPEGAVPLIWNGEFPAMGEKGTIDGISFPIQELKLLETMLRKIDQSHLCL